MVPAMITEVPGPEGSGLRTICQRSCKNGPVLNGKHDKSPLVPCACLLASLGAELALEGILETVALRGRYDLEAMGC